MRVPNQVLSLVFWLAGLNPLQVAADDRRQDLWFMAMPQADYMAMFNQPTEWARVWPRLKVFQMTTFIVSILSDADLTRAFAFLRDKGVALGLEADMQTPAENGCGDGVEGYRPKGYMKDLAARIKRLGGKLAYIAMDEPLFFGALGDDPKNTRVRFCHASVSEVARNVAGVVADVRQAFPDVLVGDTEPVSVLYQNAGGEPGVLRDWFEAFLHATGRPLAFVHFDVAWWGRSQEFDATESRWWSDLLISEVAEARRAGIGVGVIYNGRPNDASGIEWNEHAVYRFEHIEGALRITPDDPIVETWMPEPKKILPDSESGTLTHLAYLYLQWRDQREPRSR